MLPTREQAEALVAEAESIYPGLWGNHSRTAAHCAESIASHCSDMDSEKAYIVGLLHDIGRRFGHRHFGHVYDGYAYMNSLGYDEAARICLTHSFNTHSFSDYIGNHDLTEEEDRIVREALAALPVYDDYDRLIQLCDSLAGAGFIMKMEDRMNDVRARYGDYSQAKWDSNMELKAYFEKKMGMDIYEAVDKEHFRIG